MQATALPFLLLAVSGWVSRRQLAAIEYLCEEGLTSVVGAASSMTSRWSACLAMAAWHPVNPAVVGSWVEPTTAARFQPSP
jgi:hypothetical protein